MQNAAYPALALNTVWVKVVDSYSTGVNKTESVKIKVGPNPVVNELSVVASDVRSIDVYSTTGACVKRANGSQTIVNVSDLTPGLYFDKGNHFNKRGYCQNNKEVITFQVFIV